MAGGPCETPDPDGFLLGPRLAENSVSKLYQV